MIVNLELVRAIVTSEEVLLLEPLRQETIPFVDQLRRKLEKESQSRNTAAQRVAQESEMRLARLPNHEAAEDLHDELPFEFQVLEIALEVVCSYLDSSVAELERDAYPILDELAINVSTKNLEQVRSLKSNLTRLLARVQKVRDDSSLCFKPCALSTKCVLSILCPKNLVACCLLKVSCSANRKHQISACCSEYEFSRSVI